MLPQGVSTRWGLSAARVCLSCIPLTVTRRETCSHGWEVPEVGAVTSTVDEDEVAAPSGPAAAAAQAELVERTSGAGAPSGGAVVIPVETAGALGAGASADGTGIAGLEGEGGSGVGHGLSSLWSWAP